MDYKTKSKAFKGLVALMSLSIITTSVALLIHNKPNQSENQIENEHQNVDLKQDTTLKMKKVGDTLTLTCTVTPALAVNKKVNWSVSDDTKLSIVSSSDTECTVKKLKNYPGVVTITAATQEGDFKATCEVYSYNYMTNIRYDSLMVIDDLESYDSCVVDLINDRGTSSTQNVKANNQYLVLMLTTQKSSDSNRNFDYSSDELSAIKSEIDGYLPEEDKTGKFQEGFTFDFDNINQGYIFMYGLCKYDKSTIDEFNFNFYIEENELDIYVSPYVVTQGISLNITSATL